MAMARSSSDPHELLQARPARNSERLIHHEERNLLEAATSYASPLFSPTWALGAVATSCEQRLQYQQRGRVGELLIEPFVLEKLEQFLRDKNIIIREEG